MRPGEPCRVKPRTAPPSALRVPEEQPRHGTNPFHRGAFLPELFSELWKELNAHAALPSPSCTIASSAFNHRGISARESSASCWERHARVRMMPQGRGKASTAPGELGDEGCGLELVTYREKVCLIHRPAPLPAHTCVELVCGDGTADSPAAFRKAEWSHTFSLIRICPRPG